MTTSHTLTAELIAFLHEQINVDEQAALGAKGDTPGRWEEKTDPATDIVLYDQSGKLTMGQMRHIALHDPARVLAEVEAKRQLLEALWWLWAEPEQDESDAGLHARFAHPDYEYETTEGQRKAWDDADIPPYGPDGQPDHTWERNVDAGRDGWERLDYTEESYWRRRLPPEEAEQRRQERERPPKPLLILALPYATRPGYKEAWRP